MQSVTDSCTLHDVGEQDGTHFLVMEYVDGETLADRLKKGPLPIEETLRYATQIADALDKAHRQGVVHRDLKPGNVMLTKPGAKLLDFGLARMASPTRRSHKGEFIDEGGSALPTEEKPLTEKGAILGTFQYMAPEQLEGREADARTDIFAFGAVLYEMVTGKRAFAGKSQASLIGAIMNSDPPALCSLQPMTPPLLDRVANKCLAKDPDERWQTAKDLMDDLRWIAEPGSQAEVQEPLRNKRREHLAWIVTALAVLAAVVLATSPLSRSTAQNDVRKFYVSQPGLSRLDPAVSPDGKYLAFAGADASGRGSLWLRPLDSLTPQLLPGTEGAGYPFWSPDSRFIGFFSEGKLKKVDLFGTPPETLCEVEQARGQGGTWNRDGVIVFVLGDGGLKQISAEGGPVTTVTTPDSSRQETSHRWPSFLPDGHHFLYTTRSSVGEHFISVGSLDSEEPKRLFQAYSNAAYAPPGNLFFVRDGTLMVQPFDAAELQLAGDPVSLAQDVNYMPGLGRGRFSVAETGVLSYATGPSGRQSAWFDRNGKWIEDVGDPEICTHVSLSPDESRVALQCYAVEGGSTDIWVADLSRRGTFSRLTSNPGWDMNPIWSPDGKRLVFRRDGALFEKASTGAGEERKLLELEEEFRPTDWSPDGDFILYQSDETDAESDLFLLPTSGSPQPETLLQTPFSEVDGHFSPDGNWIAYASNETGQFEIYVQPFPGGGPKQQISTGGGRHPRWRQDVRELYHISNDGNLMAVPLAKMGTALEVGDPQPLFRPGMVSGWLSYAVASDGQRFLIPATPESTTASSIAVVLNWAAELEQ